MKKVKTRRAAIRIFGVSYFGLHRYRPKNSQIVFRAYFYVWYNLIMECVKIFPLKRLAQFQHEQIWSARLEAGKVWSHCKDIHLEARSTSQLWPNRTALQQATKGLYGMHSQGVQMICHTFLQNVDTTRKLRKSGVKIRYPYKTKHTYNLM